VRRSKGEEQLLAQILLCGDMEPPEEEFRFAPPRMWRFDFCFLVQRVAVEVEGGTWTRGRHSRGGGFAEDCLKYNEAAIMGYTVLRFTTQQVESGLALLTIRRALRCAEMDKSEPKR